MKGKIFPVFH